ncbi:MAG TPA: hypothetical protein VHH33_05590 [Nitrososphaeraceae archaeon]|jgi:hypothetical protein|nr:hypothetical protein [Nitrososphaeraceae archaeon]
MAKIIPTSTIQMQNWQILKNLNFSNDTNLIQTDSNNTSNISKIPKGTVAVSKNNGDNPNGIQHH